MKEKLVSLIVPVYGVEKYIRKSLDTIKNQTYKNLEIYLIDDGSKDNSGKICDEYASIDPRFKVIHKENEGQSKARNIALKLIKGEYLMYVDPDDWIDLDAIEYSVNLLEKNKTDMSIFSYKLEYETDDMVCDHDEIAFEDCDHLDSNSLNYDLFIHRYQHYAWCKLYKTSLWNDIEFPVGQIYEDMVILHKVVNRCVNGISTSSAKKYHYLQRVSSSSYGANEFSRYAWFAQARMDYYPFALEYGMTKPQCERVLMYSINNALYLYNNDYKGKYGKQALNFLLKYKDDISNVQITTKRKFLLFLLYNFRSLYNAIIAIKRR